MNGSWNPPEFPHLTETNTEITSPATSRYNCFAWAAGEDFRWWQPDPSGSYYWPDGIECAETVAALVSAYESLGYRRCKDGRAETGVEKIALFGTGPLGNETPSHAARQLACGEWTSKLGQCEDVKHSEAEDVCGPIYGHLVCYLSRPRH